jgi:hypothetical protein
MLDAPLGSSGLRLTPRLKTPSEQNSGINFFAKEILRSKKIILLDVFRPTALEDSEVSVYDLKDHPDFQYRPGTVVIRVANFEGEDAVCTAGQVLDNYPEGRVSFYQRR